jgi:hypothetical protein
MGLLTIEGSSVAKRGWMWVLAVVLVAAFAWWWGLRPPPPASFSEWVDVAAVTPAPRGTTWRSIDALPEVRAALEGRDPEALREAMRAAGMTALWVPVVPKPPSSEMPLRDRLSAGGVVRGFRGEVLTVDGLLYAIDETEWSPALADRVLARVARRVLEGAAPPPLDAYPQSLVKPQSVEVLVLLMSGRGPRLWRSARAPSIAEGLNTASLAARKRWEERVETMGGPLGERLAELDIHVALLFDDGTFASGATSLIDPLVEPRHGVAYEQPSRWRYLLPRATHNAATPTEAFRRLFVDNGLPEDSFDRRDLRLYRMRMETVSVDQGSTGSRRTGASGRTD